MIESTQTRSLIFAGLFFGWLILFTGGNFIDSNAYSLKLSSNSSVASNNNAGRAGIADYFSAVTVVFFFWTWSNIGMLCAFASLLGEVGRPLRVQNEQGQPVEQQRDLMLALTRGFLVFLLIATGNLVVQGGIETSPERREFYEIADQVERSNQTPDKKTRADLEQAARRVYSSAQYFRLAGFASLLSFLSCYNPALFRRLISTASAIAYPDKGSTAVKK